MPINLGAHLVSPRKGYDHHGIYVGGNRVVHYSGMGNGANTGPVEETTLECFANGNGYSIVQAFGGGAGAVAVNATVTGAAATAGVVGTGAALGVYGGAGMMTGLAQAGALVGGGAAAGVGVIAGGPALLTTIALNSTFLADDPNETGREREARRVARAATTVAAVGGTAASVATVFGLSGAGITSTLAVVGGGTMAAGIGVLAAGPAIAAAAVGGLAYGIAKLFD